MRRRGRFGGVVSILRYNVLFYAASVSVLLGAGLVLSVVRLSRAMEVLLIAGVGATTFWTVASLAVSWYVYDLAGVMGWDWLPHVLLFAPRAWVNIHAGLDESTQALVELFGGEHVVVDIYDAREMTEPSIARARKLHPASGPVLAGKLDALPLAEGDRDTVFLLFAAHEVRQPARRVEFFGEVARVIGDGGQVVLVEHLRDWKNFAAFGPGFLHFHSRRAWLRVAQGAGLEVAREESVTPFVRCFVMRKAVRP